MDVVKKRADWISEMASEENYHNLYVTPNCGWIDCNGTSSQQMICGGDKWCDIDLWCGGGTILAGVGDNHAVDKSSYNSDAER